MGDDEKTTAFNIGAVGSASFLLHFLMTTVHMWRDMVVHERKRKADLLKRGFSGKLENAGPLSKALTETCDSESVPEESVEELSWVYCGGSFLFNITQVWAWAVYAATGYKKYGDLSKMAVPFTMFLLFINLYAKPRRRDRMYMTFHYLNVLLWSAAIPMLAAIGDLRVGNVPGSVINICLMILYTFGFSLTRSVRSDIADLPDEELSAFLVDSMLGYTLHVVGPLLFIAFKPVRCLIEQEWEFNDACDNVIDASMFLSGYAVIIMVAKFTHDAVPKANRTAVSEWTRSKLASLHLSWKETFEFIAGLVTTVCGMYLFSVVLGKGSVNETEEYRSGTAFFGLIGCFSSLTIMLVEAMRSRSARQSRGMSLQPPVVLTKDLLTECSWIFIVISLFLAFGNAALIGAFAVTLNMDYYYMTNLTFTLTTTISIATYFMKPRYNDWRYLWFCYFHFFVQVVLKEILTIVGRVRRGEMLMMWLSVVFIFVYVAVFRLLWALRVSAANLSDVKLDHFLLDTVVTGSGKAIGPMIFLIFESMKCILDEENETCADSVNTGMYLGTFILCVLVTSLMSKATPTRVQLKVSISTEDLARFRMSARHRTQTVLFSLMALSALLLLPFLESSNDSIIVHVAGISGCSCAFLAVILQAQELLSTYKALEGLGTSGDLGRCTDVEYEDNPLQRDSGVAGMDRDRGLTKEEKIMKGRFSNSKLTGEFMDFM
jgi:hypothetical protein